MELDPAETPQQPGEMKGEEKEHSLRIHHQKSHQHFVEQQQFNLMAQHQLQQQMMREETWAGGMEGMYGFDQQFDFLNQGMHPGPASHQVNLVPHPQMHAHTDAHFFQQAADRYQQPHQAQALPHPSQAQPQQMANMHAPQEHIGALQNSVYQEQLSSQLRDPDTLPHANQMAPQQAQQYQNQHLANPHDLPLQQQMSEAMLNQAGAPGPMHMPQPDPNPAEPTAPPQLAPQLQPVRGRAIAWEELSNVAVLKHGSGTTVFSAELEGQAVAVKAPKHGLNRGSHEEVTMELRHEAKVLSNINHPHVIRFYGAGTVIVGDGHPVFFIVVEILADSLADRLKDRDGKERDSGIQSYSQAMELLLALSQAINHLHNECDPATITIHRDLKPDNIGFTHDGILKLFDFGLAAVIPRAVPVDEIRQGGGRRLPRFRLTGQTGSVRYMAPEVALNQPYNERVDTYSFAMVAYEILNKRKPFHGMTVETHRQVVCRDGQRPQLDRARPQELNLLFEACWAQDIDTRPDFSQVVQRVDLLLADSKLVEEATSGKKHGVSASMIPRAFRSFGMGIGPKTTVVSEPNKARTWF